MSISRRIDFNNSLDDQILDAANVHVKRYAALSGKRDINPVGGNVSLQGIFKFGSIEEWQLKATIPEMRKNTVFRGR